MVGGGTIFWNKKGIEFSLIFENIAVRIMFLRLHQVKREDIQIPEMAKKHNQNHSRKNRTGKQQKKQQNSNSNPSKTCTRVHKYWSTNYKRYLIYLCRKCPKVCRPPPPQSRLHSEAASTSFSATSTLNPTFVAFVVHWSANRYQNKIHEEVWKQQTWNRKLV